MVPEAGRHAWPPHWTVRGGSEGARSSVSSEWQCVNTNTTQATRHERKRVGRGTLRTGRSTKDKAKKAQVTHEAEKKLSVSSCSRNPNTPNSYHSSTLPSSIGHRSWLNEKRSSWFVGAGGGEKQRYSKEPIRAARNVASLNFLQRIALYGFEHHLRESALPRKTRMRITSMRSRRAI